MEYIRKFDFYKWLNKKSLFVFGARSTGKTYWLKKTLPADVLYLSLLDPEVVLRLGESPSLLKKMIGKKKRVVIDEVQKIPSLLDVIHSLIEDEGIHFLMTGSSARKLKRKSANMLGGRALNKSFFPLSFSEIPDFDLQRYLTYGGLPRVYQSAEPELELMAYVSSYLELEIKAEAYVRNLIPFQRFMKVAALSNGELINYASIASDAAVPASTVKEYFSILEDTLFGFVVEPWVESKKRKAIQTAKFYFFDPGVCHTIIDASVIPRASDLWGRSFEQFIGMEIRAFLSYQMKKQRLCFWRSENKQEVDFLIGNDVAIEVKSTKKVGKKHLVGLNAIKDEKVFKNYFLISEDPIERTENDIEIIRWDTFLKKLWSNEII